MSRRVRLPAAEDLFRPTTEAVDLAAVPDPAVPDPAVADPAVGGSSDRSGDDLGAAGSTTGTVAGSRRPSGRVRHDEKMTIYVTADELVDLEHARLVLRRSHRLAVDRGRFVREAVAIALADFEVNGDESVIVQRLTQS